MPRSRRMANSPAPMSLGSHPRILVVKLASLGDVLLATPALRALRRRYPAARLDLLTTDAGAGLLGDSRLIDHTYVFDKHVFDYPSNIIRHPWRALRLLPQLRALRRTRYDVVLLLHHWTLAFGRLKYRALVAAIHPEHAAGLDNGHGRLFDLRVPDHGFGARHEAEYALAVSALAGATLSPGERGLRVTDLGWDEVVPLPQCAPPLIAMHPGSGSYSVARRWPEERFAELATTLHAEYDARLLLVGGPDEIGIHERILTQLHHPAWISSRAGQLSPRGLAAMLARCVLFIGNDSFPMHLATAVGTPVVAIFGPSNARAWGPYTPDSPQRAVIVRRDDMPCSPCFYRGHSLGTPQGCPARPCLTKLEIQPVLHAARRLLQHLPAGALPDG